MSDDLEPAPVPVDGSRSALRRHGVRIGAVIALAAAAAFAAWLVFGRDDDATTAKPAVTGLGSTASSIVARPVIASAAALRAASRSSTVPIYWAGERNGTRLELTLAPGGSTFVRYLPHGASAGDTRGFLTVATYARPKAFAEVQHAATSGDSKSIDLAGGGIGIYDPAHATNVHIAYPGQPYQIEVFSPQSGTAVRLVESGAVRPAG